ncbi:Pre-mRNA-splicing factor SYF2 [Neonectria ditissima]|uniref:Pre-mRNA-splicing factor SYF2 n=1 Tax=Neonectria ditissima TaxID=78410 RepID=A0A0P7AP30_9HYPO|nr:Pre-mRNA-splicing factor SYF2 [Neonectria ditissima]
MSPPAKRRRTTRSTAKQDALVEEAAALAAAVVEVQTIEAPIGEALVVEAPINKVPIVEAPTVEASTIETSTEQSPVEDVEMQPPAEDDTPSAEAAVAKQSEAASDNVDPAAKAKERMARFKALQARAKTSSEKNLKEVTLESQRLATDPSQLTALHRKHAVASHKLLKANVEESGEDFERKRAWDWTIDESEKWDKRVKKKEAARDNNAFQDYTQENNKIYKRQLRNINPDLDRYAKDKMAAVEKAAASGGLDIVETEDGELIAVDKDGSFYSTADSTTFAQNKPDTAAVDRLVDDLRKAEEQRLKKRKERMAQNGDDGDVTYINEKNKQFNQKLSRFYNKYTAEIRDSFERGTMI